LFAEMLKEGMFSVVAVLVAAVFALAAVSKSLSFKTFRKTVAHYPVASRAPGLAASLLIAGELAAAVLLPFSAVEALAAVPALALLCMFSVTLLWFGIPHEGDCSCLGALPSARTSKQVVFRNTVLGLVIAYAAFGPAVWPSAPFALGVGLVLLGGALILWPALQPDSAPSSSSRRAAMYKVAAIAAGIALLPLLRPRDALACVCGTIISCGSCGHYHDSYHSGCCAYCTCSPQKKMVRRQWFQTCNVCCEGAIEFYCFSTYPCVAC
jgi:hypothetical protein